MNLSLYLFILPARSFAGAATPNSQREAGQSVVIGEALKYIILSGYMFTLLGLGLAYIYYLFGSLQFESIQPLGPSVGGPGQLGPLFCGRGYAAWPSGVGVSELNLYFLSILILSPILFKLNMVPFHNWAPDLYELLSFQKNAWILIIPKLFLFSFLIKWIPLLSTQILEIFIFCSIIVGTLNLYNQILIKRFLIYSSITQFGYL